MISALNWKSWFSFFNRRSQAKAQRTACARPQVEQLEDRTTPAVLDLATHGAIGTLNGGIFRQFDAQPTGTGIIDSFVRIQSIKGAVQQGFNSDYRRVQFDENTSPQFDRSLPLSEVPKVDIGGVVYREFLLDINQKASQPLLSLDEMRIYMGNAPSLTGYDTGTQQLAGLNAVYDLGAANGILLDARLNQGSGKGDMLAYIPDSLCTGGSYVYLYSKFGVNNTSNGGFEEWAAGKQTLTADTGSISGTVYQNGAPLANALVFLDANHDGVLNSNEIFTYTNANGQYRFDELATGLGSYTVYDVTVVTPAGDTTATSEIDVSLQSYGQAAAGIDFFLVFNKPPPRPGS